MTSILEKKKQKLAELEAEMNRLGYDLGLENGSGEWDMADRFAEDKETELDLKRIDHVGLMGNVQLILLSWCQCVVLQRKSWNPVFRRCFTKLRRHALQQCRILSQCHVDEPEIISVLHHINTPLSGQSEVWKQRLDFFLYPFFVFCISLYQCILLPP